MQTKTAQLIRDKATGGFFVRVFAVEVHNKDGQPFKTAGGACDAARRVFGDSLVIQNSSMPAKKAIPVPAEINDLGFYPANLPARQDSTLLALRRPCGFSTTLDHLPTEIFQEEIDLARQLEEFDPGYLKGCAISYGWEKEFDAAQAFLQRSEDNAS